MAHIEAGRLTLTPRPLAFEALMQDVASMFELEAQAKSLIFVFDVQGKCPSVVRADEKRVRQILINLLGNAIKFTTQGQVTLRLRYAREMAHIEVEDTGPGLSQDELVQIFEPFARANTPGVSAPGAGMGLTIAKMLTDLMGGELTATSRPGVGSVFKVKLFLPELQNRFPTEQSSVHATWPEQSLHRPSPARLGYAGPRQRVLVVDNEEADRELLVQVLQPLGFEVRTAASGHDALDLLAAGFHPQAVLMDLAMPGIDGWETIRRLRALEHRSAMPAAHIAVVSANAFDKGLDNDVGLPSEDFFCKPVRHADLLDWLALRLNLSWTQTVTPMVVSTIAPPGTVLIYPPPSQIDTLREVVNLGFYRGILNQLDDIEATQPQCAPFVATMRALARQFQFETMSQQLASIQHDT
jgi:CheY-like chemotaxis protein